MKLRYYLFAILAGGALFALVTSDSWARGGRGGGGGGGRGGGGGVSRGGGGFSGGARPSVSRSPSMSRPASRPSAPASRPSAPSRPATRPAGPTVGARPSTPSARPGGGSVATRPSGPAARPSTPAARPGGPSVATRPAGPGAGAARPSTGAIASTRPAGGVGAGSRPSTGQINDFLNTSSGNRGPGVSTLPAGGNRAVADVLRPGTGAGASRPSVGNLPAGGTGAGRPSTLPAPGRGNAGRVAAGIAAGAGGLRVADRAGLRNNLADNRGERLTQRQENLGDRADNIRNELNDHYDHDHLFDDFWSDHPHPHYGFDQNFLFWSWATWNTMSAFMPWNWGTPVYYDYGYGGNVYYEGDTYYVGETQIPASEYYAGVEQLATSVPQVANPDDMEWLPLGVFAITKDGDANAVPNMFLQLALSKVGILAGTYQNKTTGKTESIEGMVDKETQRAAWTIVDKNTPIMETGISNLTMNETSALMHFADGQTQQWLMVRVEGPQQETKQ